jgi:hypothetical protein
MKVLARAAAVAGVAAAFLTPAPASASCTVVPLGRSDVTYCAEGGLACSGAGTPAVDAGACVSGDGVSCHVAIPDRPLIVCAGTLTGRHRRPCRCWAGCQTTSRGGFGRS